MASQPTKIGKYDIEGVIGRGGMGVVYKAVDSQIGRYVAIKMITSGGDPSLLERFKSEARSTGSLQCPNIVTVYDFGEQDGNPYLVMQFLEGSSLESMIQKRVPLTLSERLGIIIDVCNGLAYAHQRGVIHRDIKPANIMVLQDGVNDGMAVIVDFGIARIGGDTRLTRTDQIIGSVHYMSVEQLQSKEIDNRTDVYATGVVLFQLMTGALPFDAPDTAATLLRIINDPPPLLSAYLKEYPAELDAIVGRAMAKKREERYATAKDLALDLMQVREHVKSETVAQLFQRAEVSLRREEWTRAREHLQQVLRLDRQNTQAQKLMNSVHDRLRQLQQIEQARALRGQADEAFMDQRYDDALRLLEQALALDGDNADLLAFRDSVRSAKEQAAGLRRALRRAEDALLDGDLDEAQNAVGEAFKIDPQDTQVKALKVIIAQQTQEKQRQEQARRLLDEARSQVAARDLAAAFTSLKNAEALDPTSNELQIVVKLATAARQQEKRRAETEALRQQVEAALREEDYATAVARAEEGLRRFPQEQSLLKLKALVDAQRLRVEQKKFVREQFSAANLLADSGQLRQAVAVVERGLQRVPANSELESLRANLLDRLATEEARQRRQQAIESTLVEGARLVRERGARDASEFLAAREAEFSDNQQFRELYEAVRERASLEALDSSLAHEPNPAAQVQLAEETLRQNPNSHRIQERVADLRRFRDQVNAIIEVAQGFEAAGRFPEAMQQWQQLSKSYPQFPEFESQVKRIAGLEADSQKAVTSQTAPAPAESPKPENPARDFSATVVLDSAVLSRSELSKAGTASGVTSPPVVPPAENSESPPVRPAPREKTTPARPGRASLVAGPKKYIVLASAVIILAVGYLIFGGGKRAVSVKITTSPADADVTVGGQNCRAPCDLRLQPGKYELRVGRDGYEPLTEQVSIDSGTKSLPMVSLAPKPPSLPLPVAIDQGTLIVHANVDNAEIFVDGEQKGFTEHKEYEGTFDVGSHQITLKKSGYKDSQQTVEIAKGQPTAAKVDLQKGSNEPEQFGYIVVTAKAGAAVSIDGKLVEGRVSRDGRRIQKVAPGKHTIQVRLDGYEPYNGRADVKLGEKSPINALDLKPIPIPIPTTPQPPPTIFFFNASESAVQVGQSVQLRWTLFWRTQNATVVIDQGIGSVAESGSRPVNPSQTTTYTLSARGPGGDEKKKSVTVTVKAP
jgi:eukaryotic-like serine/threonine-protein kinase